MPIPISQDPLADDDHYEDDSAESEELGADTNPARSAFLGYSDLSKPAASAFRDEWLTLPDSERLALIESLVGFAEESLDVNFHRVFRVALTDAIPRIRRLAIEGLWEDDSIDLVPMLLTMLGDDTDIEVRAEAAGSLVRFTGNDRFLKDPSADTLVRTLIEVAGDTGENALVRRRALEALGPLADDSHVERLLLNAYEDDDQSIACGAVAGMGYSGQSRWILELERSMTSDDAEMRYVAAVAAGSIGDNDLVPALARLVDDEDAEVRYAAIASIGQIGGQGALRILRNLRARDGEDDDLVEVAYEEALLLTDPLAN